MVYEEKQPTYCTSHCRHHLHLTLHNNTSCLLTVDCNAGTVVDDVGLEHLIDVIVVVAMIDGSAHVVVVILVAAVTTTARSLYRRSWNPTFQLLHVGGRQQNNGSSNMCFSERSPLGA